jgi:hypothetical protein
LRRIFVGRVAINEEGQMWFPVDFYPVTPTAPRDRMEETVGVILSGGRGNPYSWMRTPDGGRYNYAEGTVWLTRITPQTCSRMVKAAQATNTFIEVGVGRYPPMEIKGSKAKAWDMWGKAIRISSPAGLCAELRKDWNALPIEPAETPKPVADNGYVALDDPTLRPPPTPGDEAPVTNDPANIGARCEAEVRKEFEGSPFSIVRYALTQNPTWGTVWRADVGPPDNYLWGLRIACWQGRATGKLAKSKQPMAGSESLPTLEPLAGVGVVANP